jgi:hypothetical protein
VAELFKVWIDPPPSNSVVALMNNLDLGVVTTSSDGQKVDLYVGNRNGEGEWDDLNNVEQVSVSKFESEETDIVVHIRATVVAEFTQPFALVVSGNVTESESCVNQCTRSTFAF